MTLKFKILLSFSLLLCFSSCNNKNSNVSQLPTFDNIELNRGDLLLCGDPNFGEVNFSLSCRYDLRETFNLGLTLIHSFEYAEAEKVFVSILDNDPECLMAYWGTAMSILNHPLSFKQNPKSLKRGEELLKIAKTLSPNNEREMDYIDAVSIYFKNWQNLDTQTRKLNYESKMEELYYKYPDDVETAVFYSLSILATADLNDKTYTKQKKSGEILEKLFLSESVKTKDANQLTALIRPHLGRIIVQDIISVNEELPIITLEQPLEQLLNNSIQNDSSSNDVFLEPKLIESIVASVSIEKQNAEERGNPAVMVVSPKIRPWLSRILRQRLGNLSVLAYTEIPEDQEIRVIGRVGIQDEQQNQVAA